MAETNETTGKSGEPTVVEIPIEFYVPDGLPILYSDGQVVQYTEHGFCISFFQAEPPIVFDNAPKEQLAKLTKVRSKCVARVFLASGQMAKFADAIQKNMVRLSAQSEKKDGE